MQNALNEIEKALAAVNSTGFEVQLTPTGYASVTIYGVKDGCKPYAIKSKQALGTGKSFAIAFTRALKLFTETK